MPDDNGFDAEELGADDVVKVVVDGLTGAVATGVAALAGAVATGVGRAGAAATGAVGFAGVVGAAIFAGVVLAVTGDGGSAGFLRWIAWIWVVPVAGLLV